MYGDKFLQHFKQCEKQHISPGIVVFLEIKVRFVIVNLLLQWLIVWGVIQKSCHSANYGQIKCHLLESNTCK